MKVSILTSSIVLALFMTSLSNPLSANSCAKCKKIEADRATQEPQNPGYYDHEHPEEVKTKEEAVKSNTSTTIK
jgi:hypothetical protein